MSVIVSFSDYTPVERYDDISWSSALIEEAAAIDGTWALIDTVALTPADSDPANPSSRSFTTSLGTAAALWYRVSFADAFGGTSLPTVPLQNVAMLRAPYATASELAIILHITEAPNRAALARVLTAASSEIDAELGVDAPYSDPPPLVVEVCLERAVEHWQQMKSPFGIIGLGAEAGATHTATDSWGRHASKLAPLKMSWGVA